MTDTACLAAAWPMCPTMVPHLLINTSCQVQRLASVHRLLAAVTGTLWGACCLISSREGRWPWQQGRGRGMFWWRVLAGLEMSGARRELQGPRGGPGSCAGGSSFLGCTDRMGWMAVWPAQRDRNREAWVLILSLPPCSKARCPPRFKY